MDVDSTGEQFFEPTGANQTSSSKRRRTSGDMRDKSPDDDDEHEPCFGEVPEETSDRFQSDRVNPPSYATSERSEDKTEQQCPVCSRTLMADNQGLNEHIDFCLSRDAIREARSSARVR